MFLARLKILCLLGVLVSCERATGDYVLDYVQDGDSVVICCEQGEKITVRLRDIDAPEKGQPFANQSRQFLRQLLADKSFQLQGSSIDRYGRRLADIVFQQDQQQMSVNQIMIETGHAWAWRYSDSLKLKYLQKKAREAKKGLWALPEAQRQDPWQWRQQHQRQPR